MKLLLSFAQMWVAVTIVLVAIRLELFDVSMVLRTPRVGFWGVIFLMLVVGALLIGVYVHHKEKERG